MIVSSVQGSEIAQTSAKQAAENNTQQSAAASPIQPYYFSPALVIDPKSGTDVLEFRNKSTGAVINQYPSEKDLKAYSQTSVQPTATKPPVVQTQPAKQQATAGDTSAQTTAQTAITAVSQTAVIV